MTTRQGLLNIVRPENERRGVLHFSFLESDSHRAFMDAKLVVFAVDEEMLSRRDESKVRPKKSVSSIKMKLQMLKCCQYQASRKHCKKIPATLNAGEKKKLCVNAVTSFC